MDTNTLTKRAIGRYVDLRVLGGLEPRDAFFEIRKEYGHKVAQQAQRSVD